MSEHRVERLQWHQVDAVRDLLNSWKTGINLFPLTLLEERLFNWNLWTGWWAGDELRAVVFHWPKQYTLPVFHSDASGDRELEDLVTAQLSSWNLGMLLGQRGVCDKIANNHEYYTPPRKFDHVIMGCSHVEDGDEISVELARLRDVPEIAHHGMMMTLEDFGIDPSKTDRETYMQTVRARVLEGRTWVVREGGDIIFQVSIGYHLDDVAQIGGTYVAPNRRGQGLSVRAMRAAVRQALTRWKLLVLEVNEVNVPAVRCYQRVGFKPLAQLRIYTPRDDTQGDSWQESKSMLEATHGKSQV